MNHRTGPAILLQGLSRRFGEIQAVEDLTLSVEWGELFGLLGPDGAGKTTTLRMLAGVLKPSAGDARVAGLSVTRDPDAVKHEIAYMSQRFGLYMDLTVLENITFYADLYLVPAEERPSRIERLFAFSRLGPFEDRLAGALSGGMKQKLGLCCALIHQPSVLLLDEPTFGVDPVSRRELWMIIHDMVGRGTTVLVTTSYMDEAERFDRLAILDRGRLRAIGSPDALREEIGLEILVVTTPQTRRARDVALGVQGVLSATVFGDSVHLAVGSAAEMTPRVREELSKSGIEVLGIRAVSPGMEDVFIDWTTRKGGGGRSGG